MSQIKDNSIPISYSQVQRLSGTFANTETNKEFTLKLYLEISKDNFMVYFDKNLQKPFTAKAANKLPAHETLAYIYMLEDYLSKQPDFYNKKP